MAVGSTEFESLNFMDEISERPWMGSQRLSNSVLPTAIIAALMQRTIKAAPH